MTSVDSLVKWSTSLDCKQVVYLSINFETK